MFVRLLSVLALSAVSFAYPVISVFAQPSVLPLPRKVMQAKTVFVENRSRYIRARDEFANELGKWNRFRIVYDKTAADMLVILTVQVTQQTTQIAFLEPTSGEEIWTSTMKWSDQGAVRDIMADLKKRIEIEDKQTDY